MEKSLIIIGPRCSGKTRRALEIIKSYPPINTLWMCFRNRRYEKDMFLFSDCTQTTEIILFDDIQKSKVLTFVSTLVKNGVCVRKKGVHDFIIFPKFIITCDESITESDIPESLLRDFDVVHSSSLVFE